MIYAVILVFAVGGSGGLLIIVVLAAVIFAVKVPVKTKKRCTKRNPDEKQGS